MNLFEVDNAIANFVFEVDEVTGEVKNFDALDALNMERDRKIEFIALEIKNLDAEARAIKAECESLAERQKAKERKRDNWKRYLENALHGEKFETPKCSISYRKSTSVAVGKQFEAWAKENAPSLLNVTMVVKPDKTAIKEAIKNGAELVDAELVENVNMQIK